MKNRGLNTHRFKDNPEEKRFAEAWERSNETGALLDHLLDTRQVHTGWAPDAGDQARLVAATVIQWLGSPVGRAWLSELGYELRPKGQASPAADVIEKMDSFNATRGRLWDMLRKSIMRR